MKNNTHKTFEAMSNALLAITEQSHATNDLEELQNLIDTEFQKVVDAAESV